jgi:hypothetical protein
MVTQSRLWAITWSPMWWVAGVLCSRLSQLLYGVDNPWESCGLQWSKTCGLQLVLVAGGAMDRTFWLW